MTAPAFYALQGRDFFSLYYSAKPREILPYCWTLTWLVLRPDVYLALLKGQKRLRFRVIYLIEFIQSNNFHIYSIF